MSIAIIGTGLISSELINQLKIIKRNNSDCSLLKGLNLLGIIDTKHMLTSKNSSTCLLSKLSSNIKHFLADCDQSKPSDMDEFVSALATLMQQDPDNKEFTIIDCTASETVAKLYPQLILKKFNIVTPNKVAFSTAHRLYDTIFENCKNTKKRCLFESSVLAGLPVIKTIKEIIKSGDEICSIEGVFSGSLSYIFNNLNKTNNNLYELIMEAKNKGYTEPDIRQDLSGMDVARKVVILSRIIGLQIELEDVRLESIIPKDIAENKALMNLNNHEFEEQLKTYYEKHGNTQNKAIKRYVGSIEKEKKEIKVMTKEYESDHIFANLNKNMNIIIIKTTRFDSSGITIMGAGAGAKETAHGILTDLVAIYDN